jgi:arsenate reductase
MAEAIVNTRMADRWQAVSAGVEPADRINPFAIRALAEIGIPHHGEPKHVERFLHEDLDLVVTVCDDAAENCPVWLGRGKKVHLGFMDPAKARGSDEEKMQVYRNVLNQIAEKIPVLLTEKEKELVS